MFFVSDGLRTELTVRDDIFPNPRPPFPPPPPDGGLRTEQVGVDRVFGNCSEHGAYELPLGSIDSGEIERRCPGCVAEDGHSSERRQCHVYVAAAAVLPIEKPDGDCWVCGLPLCDHAKQVSSLVPEGQIFVIDEKALDV